MHKMSAGTADLQCAHQHAKTFRRETTSSGGNRLVAGFRDGDAALLLQLSGNVPGPFEILYVLHTPRGEGTPGRYQSPEISREELALFLDEYGEFLGCDARVDFWLHCITTGATLVWDRHNLLYAYGPISDFEVELEAHGFSTGEPTIPSPHAHNYHQANDAVAMRVLKHWSWQRSDLRPEDWQ